MSWLSRCFFVPILSFLPFVSPPNLCLSPFCTITTLFDHNQCPFSPCMSHSPLVITPLQPFLPFLGPSFSALVLLCYLSTTPTLNTFVPLMQWSTSYLPLFVGKTHQVMSHLIRLAVDLAALCPLVYPHDSKTGFRATHISKM